MSAAAHDNTSEPCLPHQAKVREANGVKGEVARVERTTGGLMRQLYHELGRLRRPSSFVLRRPPVSSRCFCSRVGSCLGDIDELTIQRQKAGLPCIQTVHNDPLALIIVLSR